MDAYVLPNGREVFLVRLSIVPTYGEMIEGSREDASPFLLVRAANRAARVMEPAKPMVLVKPERFPLPSWMWIAELGSRRGVRITNPDFSSRLYVCWFVGDEEKNIDSSITSMLPHVRWEESAEDYDSMMF